MFPCVSKTVVNERYWGLSWFLSCKYINMYKVYIAGLLLNDIGLVLNIIQCCCQRDCKQRKESQCQQKIRLHLEEQSPSQKFYFLLSVNQTQPPFFLSNCIVCCETDILQEPKSVVCLSLLRQRSAVRHILHCTVCYVLYIIFMCESWAHIRVLLRVGLGECGHRSKRRVMSRATLLQKPP